MITLEKLLKLPLHQRLRKIEKILTQYEYQLVGKQLGTEKISDEYIQNMVYLLVQDNEFDEPIREYLKSKYLELQTQIGNREPVNRIRHLLLSLFGTSVADWDFIDAEGRLSRTRDQYISGMQVFLEDIRSPFNVGAMFRTAECFGVEKIYLSSFCADPLHPRAERSAMGCVAIVPWERRSLENLDGPLFALETGGIPLDEFMFPENAIMIVGSEELGVSPEALQLADSSLGRVSIPTIGAKGSLNVAVAFGIAMQRWHQSIAHRLKPQPLDR